MGGRGTCKPTAVLLQLHKMAKTKFRKHLKATLLKSTFKCWVMIFLNVVTTQLYIFQTWNNLKELLQTTFLRFRISPKFSHLKNYKQSFLGLTVELWLRWSSIFFLDDFKKTINFFLFLLTSFYLMFSWMVDQKPQTRLVENETIVLLVWFHLWL